MYLYAVENSVDPDLDLRTTPQLLPNLASLTRKLFFLIQSSIVPKFVCKLTTCIEIEYLSATGS